MRFNNMCDMDSDWYGLGTSKWGIYHQVSGERDDQPRDLREVVVPHDAMVS